MSTNEMKFCTECGNQVTISTIKCPRCGKVFKVGKVVEKELTHSYKKVTAKIKEHADNKDEYIEKTKKYVDKGKTSLPKIRGVIAAYKKLGILIASLLGAILIGIAGVKVISMSHTPEKLIEKFELAVINHDYKALAKLLVCEDKRVMVDEQAVARLVECFEETPSTLSSLISDLKTQVDELNEGYDLEQDGLLTIEQKSGKNGYQISVKPVFISLETGLDDVQISVGQQEEVMELDTETSKEIGPFLPGIYNIDAVYKDEFLELEEQIEINLFETSQYDNMAYLEVFTDVQQVTLASDYNDVVIYINDKSTEVTIEESDTIYPVNAEMKIYGVVTRDGKEFKSEEYIVGSEDYFYLEFPKLEQYEDEQDHLNEEIEVLMGDYLTLFAEAVNVGDFSIVEQYLYPNSGLYNMQKTNIPNMYDTGIRERLMSYQVIDISFDSDSKTGYVTVEEVYEVTKQDPTESVEEMKFENVYRYEYNSDEQMYQITEICK